MEFCPLELEFEVLERVNAHQLKNVFRVCQVWRSFIKDNVKRMRSFPCSYVHIECYAVNHPTIYIAPDIGRRVFSRYQLEVFSSLQSLFKYRPTSFLELTEINPSISKRNDETKTLLDSIPNWWIKSVREVRFPLSENFPYSFILRFTKLDEMYITVDNEELLIDFLRRARNVRQYWIIINDGILGDSVLKILQQKSSIEATEFPFITGECKFSLRQLCRFLEINHFPVADGHFISLSSPVIGNLNDWTNWLKKNTTPSPKLTTFRRAIGRNYLSYYFVFRCMYFIVETPEFISN